MNRFAANHPEDWESRMDAMIDAGDQRRKERPARPSDYDPPMQPPPGETVIEDDARCSDGGPHTLAKDGDYCSECGAPRPRPERQVP